MNKCGPMELFVTRGGETQREGPGKMASSLMSESKLLFHCEFLWPFLCHGSRGSWCAMSGAVIVHRPGVQVKASDGVLPLLLPQYLSQAFLALQHNF